MKVLPNIAALYGRTAPARLITLYRQVGGPLRYLARYWTTQHFNDVTQDASTNYRLIRLLLGIGMIAQVFFGLVLLCAGLQDVVMAGTFFGAALIVSYPIVWAHVLFLLALGWQLMHPKRYGKALLCVLLERQVRQLRAQNDFTLIAVAGSVGKTSTKLSIAQLLGTTRRVRYQEGNYNDRLTVPLVIFNVHEPSIYNVLAWLRIYSNNRRKLRQPYPFDVVVVELGTDGPGQMKDFAYLQPDLTVLTSVAEEHMEYFKTLDAVAAEELEVFEYSAQVLANTDDIAEHYLAKQSFQSYGTKTTGDYHVKLVGSPTKDGQKLTMRLQQVTLTVMGKYYGEQGAKVLLAAATVGHMVGMTTDELKSGLATLAPFSGRLQVLAGAEESTLLDDTYNASPLAVHAALDVLYAMDTKQRVAILGSMNELGDVSNMAHAKVGSYCDPNKLALVVTIGKAANEYLAPAAEQRGCTVKSFDNPKDAGEYVRNELKRHAVVLAKGSQNGVFAEEALKPLLASPDDAQKLVRQSSYWMSIKRAQFGG